MLIGRWGAELRIHPETERGDNATIKMGGKSLRRVTGECCGAF